MSTMAICLLIFALMVILLFLNKIPMSFTAMIVLVLLVVTGCIDASTALSTFGSTTVITMVSMYIVAAGLTRTQMITHVSNQLYKITGGSYLKIVASYVIITCILGQFVPSIVALFAMVAPLVKSMCDETGISPSKMMYPVAIAAVSTSFIIEPIGPYAAWFITQNGYLESYGWTGELLSMWSETAVLLPVGLVTILVAIFIVPKFLPETPDVTPTLIQRRESEKKEPLSPVREVLGYGVFAAVIIGLMLGLDSWLVSMVGAIIIVASGVLTEREAIANMNMSTILLYVGVSVLGTALGNTGAAELLGDQIAGLLGSTTNGYIIGAVFYTTGFIMTSLLYNRAVSTVLTPLAIITCTSIGCDPRGPIILCALSTMSSLVTPLATAVVPMAMNAGGYSQKTLLKAGLIPAVIRGVVGVLIAMTLFPAF